ncbi:MAG: DNA repair protein RecO [Kiritimatiellaeota bacterium]|nr:DNA repair protein RecO [Kiritimatiellota bacterium]
MFITTEAIALRVSPWGNTSHLVTWLTPAHGRVTTRVKGACRPKSFFLGQYDLFYTCELVFYTRETGGVHSIREASPLDCREALRGDWRSACAANYYADLAHHTAMPMQESGAQYGLLQGGLDALCAAPPRVSDILWHEARLLKILGLAPILTPCPECHADPSRPVRYSVTAARPLCGHTRPPAPTDLVVTLPPGDLRALDLLFNAPAPPAQKFSLGIFRFFGIFMRLHIELPMGARRTLFDLFNSLPPRQTPPCGGV